MLKFRYSEEFFRDLSEKYELDMDVKRVCDNVNFHLSMANYMSPQLFGFNPTVSEVGYSKYTPAQIVGKCESVSKHSLKLKGLLEDLGGLRVSLLSGDSLSIGDVEIMLNVLAKLSADSMDESERQKNRPRNTASKSGLRSLVVALSGEFKRGREGKRKKGIVEDEFLLDCLRPLNIIEASTWNCEVKRDSWIKGLKTELSKKGI